jgi:hypothetical protein
MPRDFFDLTAERQTSFSLTVRLCSKAERWSNPGKSCNPEGAETPSDNVLDRVNWI